MFLEYEELQTVADLNLLIKITNNNNDIFTAILAESIGLMRSYLQSNYDTETVFNATATDRNYTVVKYLKDIVVYEIYMRHTREINEAAAVRYDNAMRWLEMVNTGKLSMDLPPAIDTNTEDTEGITLSFGGNTKYITNF